MATYQDFQNFQVPSSFGSVAEAKAWHEQAQQYLPYLQYSGNSRLRDLIGGFGSMLRAIEQNVSTWSNVSGFPRTPEQIAAKRAEEEAGTLEYLNRMYVPQMTEKLQRDKSDVAKAAQEAQQKIDNFSSNIANLEAGIKDGKITDPAEIARINEQVKAQQERLKPWAEIGQTLGLQMNIVQDARGNWISKADADAARAAGAVPGGPPAGTAQTGTTAPVGASTVPSFDVSSISFKEGLSEAQKQSIINLVQNRPASEWNDTDRANWNYATNNAPLPTFRDQTGQTTRTGPMPSAEAPGGPQRPSGTRYQILNIEMMGQYSPDQYERLPDGAVVLKPGVPPIPGTTKTYGENVLSAADEAIIDEIANKAADDPNMLAAVSLTPEDIDKWITEGLASAKIEFGPYYQQQSDRILAQYKQGTADLITERNLELEFEKISREKEKKAIQEDLEARGQTFSGEAIATLGTESALSPELRKELEGTFQATQRLVSSSSALRFGQQARALGEQAEEILGEKTIAGATPLFGGQPLYTSAVPGYRGSLEREKETAEQTRAREIARAKVSRRLAISPDFPIADYLQYI